MNGVAKNVLLAVAALAALIALAALGGYWLFESRPEPEWTTESPQALEEYENAIEAMKKGYWSDAGRFLDRALELDPAFAMARIDKAMFEHGLMSPEVTSLIASIDPAPLNARESLLLRFLAAHLDGRHDEAKRLLEAYLAAHPDDPHARNISCRAAWLSLEWDDAERCYQELIERHPNWVEGQNRLGYIAMARGRFDHAEERFEAYRFVAPDQAQPHDSLGQLAMLRGRYPEAETFFRRALAVKPDYCTGYFHLTQLQVFAGDFAAAQATLEALAGVEACQQPMAEGMVCYAQLQIAYLEGDYERAWERFDSCRDDLAWSVLPHRVALLTGRDEEAAAIEAKVQQAREEAPHATPLERKWMRALVLTMEGGRLLAAGDAAAAAQRFAAADELTFYWGDTNWSLKLFVRTDWLTALEGAGETSQATELQHMIESVNPRFLEAFGPAAETLAARGRR